MSEKRSSWLIARSSFKRVLLFLVLLALPLLTTAKRQVHNFEGKCETCHLSLTGEKMIFVRDIDFLCKDCHRDLGFSHPSGRKPSMALPEQFPVDWAGRMTCATCHAVHGGDKYLLRGSGTGKLFCYSCHKGTFESHHGVNQPAHSNGAVSGSGFQVVDSTGSIDKASRECLGCHDSTIGSSATTRVGSGTWSHDSGGSHPIGIDYMSALRKSRGGFVHPSRMNQAVKLFDGKVGCGSCHNIFSKEQARLTVKMGTRSDLCLSCHIK